MYLVIGLGETGRPLYEILKEAYPDTHGADIKTGLTAAFDVTVMNICFPYSENFVEEVKNYQGIYKPKLTIIHSTVPIGTTSQIPNAVHSPILGRHDNMKQSIKSFTKWVGGKKAAEASIYLSGADIQCNYVETSEETEALKLMCLAKYGMSIAFAGYQKEICDKYGIDYADVLKWDRNYNLNVAEGLQRPLLTPPEGKIGGHCVIQNTRLLNKQHPNPILSEILKYDPEKSYKAWGISNIYQSASIGMDVNIGTFCEIGANVVIGDRVRIGAMSFIPEGVVIEDDAWIGPKVCFTNDRYPPSGREHWEKTVIKKGARLGAAVTVICGVTIGEGALVGAGSVVTKDIPTGEKWAGVPAKKMGNSIVELGFAAAN